MLNLNIYFSVFLENVMNFHEFKRPYSSSFKTNEGGGHFVQVLGRRRSFLNESTFNPRLNYTNLFFFVILSTVEILYSVIYCFTKNVRLNIRREERIRL